MKKQKPTKIEKDEAEEWDFSDGFGGLPEEIDLKHNLGCASDRKKKDSKSKTDDQNKKQ
ncbi:hypothetical protein [Cecembia lonarensis]|uniref:Uncharacterized protein n=1 Tax=Cecembia lonarensis (strain CCUG 58316 / KCTC 22772 / LW9) TaxID=1225176 RepID=K1M3F6_CECL9|nr:hypothetical protein [Cecembia lonarensis]EKB50779.1 hypothetical protein B879_00524 [Cecembia lonarensis LW9]